MFDTERFTKFYNELEFFLNNAPTEEDCSDAQNEVYSEMANLKNTIENYRDDCKETKVSVQDNTEGYDRSIWSGKGMTVT